MNILLVEDDHEQAELIVDFLISQFPRGKVDLIRTEQEFRAHLDEIERQPPDVVVLDMMLRWTDPSPAMEPRPQDVIDGGHYRAGLRCKDLLAAREKTRTIPVILYTALERGDVPKLQEIMLLSKELDPVPLAHSIRTLTKRFRTPLPEESP